MRKCLESHGFEVRVADDPQMVSQCSFPAHTFDGTAGCSSVWSKGSCKIEVAGPHLNSQPFLASPVAFGSGFLFTSVYSDELRNANRAAMPMQASLNAYNVAAVRR